MLKIKWNLVPSQFKYGVIERASGDICVCIHSPIIEGNTNDWDYTPDGRLDNYVHNLCEGEYDFGGDDPSLDFGWDNRIYSREDWEREQWASAPEWAMYYVIQPDNTGRWFNQEPYLTDTSVPCWNAKISESQHTSFIFQYGEDWKQSLRKRPEAKVQETELLEEDTILSIDMRELGTIISETVMACLIELSQGRMIK